MSLVSFELITPEFERAKTFHALDRASTFIGLIKLKFFVFVNFG
jgi:hypothetical protein